MPATYEIVPVAHSKVEFWVDLAARAPTEPGATSFKRASMDGFFLPEVLDTTRLLVLNDNRVENPPFYVPLRRMGFTNLPGFSTIAAVTFCDVVVAHQQFSDVRHSDGLQRAQWRQAA